MYSVLVVDDQQELRQQLVKILTDRRFQVEEAGNGREALAWLSKKDFSLVLCDVKMPEMDGLDASRRICAQWPADSHPD